MKSLLEIIENRVDAKTARTQFTFLPSGEDVEEVLTLETLRKTALLWADSITPGSCVLLFLPQGLSFIKGFFACLYAGAVAVPVSLPTRNRGFDRVENIIKDADIRIGITSRSVLANLNRWHGEQLSGVAIKWLLVEELDGMTAEAGTDFQFPRPESLAFLQYTSGSTGRPKAVCVTHANIIANSKIIQKCFQTSSESLSVCWLPSFHDMGLIDGVIQPIFSNFRSVLLSPTHFLQRPSRWLKAITKYRATYSGGPNFAFDFCAERIREDELSEIDLSSLNCLYNGSEPIRPRTLRRFIERFGRVGFSEKMIFTCYGLAEATLAVTTSKLGHFPKIVEVATGELASCGVAYEDTTLRIVNPETEEICPEREEGEIWVSGESITSGYLNRPRETAETYVEVADSRFVRTGDLGFLLDNELYVTGRIKDLIIIRGKNHYPHDIEQTVTGCAASLKQDGCAAFSVDKDGEEQLVIVQEIRRTHLQVVDIEHVLSLIAIEISHSHGLSPLDIVLVRPGTLPKTTSGKIQRGLCRKMWLEEQLNPIRNSGKLES
jgi:acyl-CoA synthetase (AMP-forming)/AMP-acid ligase II